MQISLTYFQYPSRYICYLALMLSVLGCSADEDIPVEDVRTELMSQINELRTAGCKCGNDQLAPVEALTWNTALEDAAKLHANDMHQNNYFSHLSLDGTPPIARAQQMGFDGEYVGEVIARKYFSTKDVIQGWKESESHCRALMDSLYNEMGGARKEDYWVVDLGKAKN